jgi:type I restriction enzyme M protein
MSLLPSPINQRARGHPSPVWGGISSAGRRAPVSETRQPFEALKGRAAARRIRRWIIENDWLDAIVALPEQLFYNTGIYTYLWLVTNRKPQHRRGKVQLIDATRHFQKMKKSLGNKRNELSEMHIDQITKLYAAFKEGGTCKVRIDDNEQERVCSKIFDNREFGFIKLTIERPLRLNFQASAERIERLKKHSTFIDLAESKKRKDKAKIEAEQKAGRELQQSILAVLTTLDPVRLYANRRVFETDLDSVLMESGVKISPSLRKAIISALSERDPTAAACTDADGNPEPDPELRDTESVVLPANIELPLPIDFGKDADNTELVDLVRAHCKAYFAAEVQPHWPDAWIDFSKTKIGYEIPINRTTATSRPRRARTCCVRWPNARANQT